TGALAVSVFAAGQFVGRLGGGWLLDHFRPQTVALVFTVIPGSGFLLLLLTDQLFWAAILAAAMIGLQQGVELDLFAYFVARRFPIAQYGTIYGALHGFSWIGNATGIIGVGLLHDSLGSYSLAQGLGMAALTLGAILVWAVRLPPLASAPEQLRAG
ncbi:MAG: MFS transporter, partial [Novosphingobium sp.]